MNTATVNRQLAELGFEKSSAKNNAVIPTHTKGFVSSSLTRSKSAQVYPTFNKILMNDVEKLQHVLNLQSALITLGYEVNADVWDTDCICFTITKVG